ncbi:MAG: PEP-CTERM sorting domain-containing protein [Sphingopyxis sp.]|uniref:PEPxxWA-CTERM sorting domain-containing protein n=1 Tax=Sphingopyxis sp. TaxID=1908224 RepID=UPI001A4535EC|nr:PEPxxWA-CTERM sorting domain-containing protein [Sphingopyxis sp.]MBL9068874.1 PEP-CTERM sorting domain-containing protein [Sphingopyxis sp.]
MKRTLILAAATLAAIGTATASQAATQVVNVNAQGNSSSGGTGYNTGLGFVAGEIFSTSVALTDLWSAGALPRWSNADGLTSDLFATGTDESGEAAGTQIGVNFGTWTQDGFTAPYGALVGKIGNTYKLLGTSYNGPAWDTGSLQLFYWDSNSGDNRNSVAVSIAAVPEPATWAMMLFGFALAGFAMRRRSSGDVRTTVRYA